MIEFHVPGDPAPQGSKNAYQRGGRIVLVEASTRVKPWRAAVTLMAQEAATGTLTGPVAVTLHFALTRPKSSKRHQPTTKPDLDKLVRAVLDGITDSGIWKDDSQVCQLTAAKTYGPTPGVQVRIEDCSAPAATATT